MIYTMQGLENDHPIREMLFNLLPTEIPERADIAPEGADALGVVVERAGAENRIRVCCVRGGKQICAEKRAPISDDAEQTKRVRTHALKSAIFEVVVPFLDTAPEWGSLTGVRPAKFARSFMDIMSRQHGARWRFARQALPWI